MPYPTKDTDIRNLSTEKLRAALAATHRRQDELYDEYYRAPSTQVGKFIRRLEKNNAAIKLLTKELLTREQSDEK